MSCLNLNIKFKYWIKIEMLTRNMYAKVSKIWRSGCSSALVCVVRVSGDSGDRGRETHRERQWFLLLVFRKTLLWSVGLNQAFGNCQKYSWMKSESLERRVRLLLECRNIYLEWPRPLQKGVLRSPLIRHLLPPTNQRRIPAASRLSSNGKVHTDRRLRVGRGMTRFGSRCAMRRFGRYITPILP